MLSEKIKNADEIGSKPVRNRATYHLLKRIIDIFGSLIGLLVLIVPMVIITVAIMLDSKGPAIFKQPRMGKGAKPFTCIKFRTMYISAPKSAPTALLDGAESHITRVGAFLRKFSLDETPQLINILLGDMSFIGPRPVILEELELIELRKNYGIYKLRPGLSGWAQVNGRDLVDIEHKAELDRYYLEHESLFMDIKIFFLSIKYAVAKKDVVEGNKDYVAPNIVIEEKEPALSAKE